MIKPIVAPATFAGFCICFFFASCNGQVPAETTEGRPQSDNLYRFPFDPKIASDTSEQISEYVVSIFEDSHRNLWFGTMSDGAVRYGTAEGQPGNTSLTYFSTKEGICDNTVASIAEDHQGNIWFGTHNGASRFDGKTVTNFGLAEGLHGAGCKILVDRKGTIWAGTNHGVFKYSKSNQLTKKEGFSAFNLPIPPIENLSYKWEAGKVWHIMQDRKGDLWFARDGYGACKYDGKSFRHFTQRDGLCSNNVSNIVEDAQGNLWFACLNSYYPKKGTDGGLCCYDGKIIRQFKAIEGLSKNDIYTVFPDKKGDIWIGATHFGAYRYSKGKFTLYKKTNRMDLTNSFGLQSMLEDSKGRLWFGFSGGLFRFDANAIVNVTKLGPWK